MHEEVEIDSIAKCMTSFATAFLDRIGSRADVNLLRQAS
jgi:hypothetical protein